MAEISEQLVAEIDVALQEFSLKPTQSGRVKLRQRLRTIADAINVDAYQHEGEARENLHRAAAKVLELSELALVAPVDLLKPEGAPEAPKKPSKQQSVHKVVGLGIVLKLISEAMRGIRRIK